MKVKRVHEVNIIIGVSGKGEKYVFCIGEGNMVSRTLYRSGDSHPGIDLSYFGPQKSRKFISKHV
jgi:hypothetical protein